jgi:hypothetical protein
VKDELVLRGVLDQTTLKYINIGWYQREQGFSGNHINEIIAGYFMGGNMSDIVLGMRGQRCTSRGTTYFLHDKCFCIDGGQRLYAAALAVKERPDLKIKLGAKVYIGTTEEFENDLFCRLGTTQVRISASVLMRNRKKKSEAAAVLVALNKDDAFAMKDRVGWDQVKTRHELMTGFTFARIVGALHAHKSGALRSSKVYDLLQGLDSLVETIGPDNLRTNMIRFFDAIDKCWTVRQLSGARDEPRPHLRAEFLLTVCWLLSTYSDFWDGTAKDEFYFPDKFIRRLKGLKVDEYLRSTKKLPKDVLYEVLRKRLNLDPIFASKVDEAAE